MSQWKILRCTELNSLSRMICSRTTIRATSIASRTCKQGQKRCFRNVNRPDSIAATKPLQNTRTVGLLFALTIGGGCLYASGYPPNAYAETGPTPAEVTFEKARRKAESREENRDLISSQHLQVKRSWENPGVYACKQSPKTSSHFFATFPAFIPKRRCADHIILGGNNSGRVVAPDSDEPNIKNPRRITYFDGKIIRDIQLDKTFGAAINEDGDLLQWGTGYSTTSSGPQPTLIGKDLVKLSISRDRIIGLSSSGKVYSIPAAQADQKSEPKPLESTWVPFWNSRSTVGYRILQPSNMAWGEKVSDISSGLEHCLLLTSKGRLFSAASGTEDFPSKGQMGIPGLTWKNRPEGDYDQPHEIGTLRGFRIAKIAAGDFHSLAVDDQGRVFAFGDNSVGQLGFDYTHESPIIDAPSLLPTDKLYKGTNQIPKVTNVAAGGVNSFFTIDATKVAGQGENDPKGLGRVTADTWACGQGIFGGLGNGKWTHVQGTPTKIKTLSGLFEWDEVRDVAIPIRLARLSVGATHMVCI